MKIKINSWRESAEIFGLASIFIHGVFYMLSKPIKTILDIFYWEDTEIWTFVSLGIDILCLTMSAFALLWLYREFKKPKNSQ